jgi:hypothetical protein
MIVNQRPLPRLQWRDDVALGTSSKGWTHAPRVRAMLAITVLLIPPTPTQRLSAGKLACCLAHYCTRKLK